MSMKTEFKNYAPRKTERYDQAWFLVRWGNDAETELVIWPVGEGGCSWSFDGTDDPEYLSRQKIKEEQIFFKGPIAMMGSPEEEEIKASQEELFNRTANWKFLANFSLSINN